MYVLLMNLEKNVRGLSLIHMDDLWGLTNSGRLVHGPSLKSLKFPFEASFKNIHKQNNTRHIIFTAFAGVYLSAAGP